MGLRGRVGAQECMKVRMCEGGKVVVVRADADWISTCLVAVNEINRCGCDWGWLVWQGEILDGGCVHPVGRLAG